ncbi:type II toxin-antitoxin system death-on-curing family toxin [Weissella kandleri]|uniref:type II toxin-antitoxin system death-on-curing family toxin n=1 Tax=Weissella kandleri TaxID=1616 RepID=UPI00387E5E1A
MFFNYFSELYKNKVPLFIAYDSESELNNVIDIVKKDNPELKNAEILISDIIGENEFVKYINIRIKFTLDLKDYDVVIPAIILKVIFMLDIEGYRTLNDESQSIFEEAGVLGMYGIKDIGKLESINNRIAKSSLFGYDPHPNIINKAASLWVEIAQNQVFHNGNKRTAMLAALLYLRSNFYDFTMQVPKGIPPEKNILYMVSMKIARHEIGVSEVEEFIKKHVSLDVNLMRIYNDEYVNTGKEGEVNG